MERSWRGTDFFHVSVCPRVPVCTCVPVCASVCPCVPVCAHMCMGTLTATEPMGALALPADSFSFVFVEIWTHLHQQQQSQTTQKGTSFFLASTFGLLTFHWQLLPI